MVDPNIDPEELAEVIAALHNDRSRYTTLKMEAEARRDWASWKRVAAELETRLP
jgi:glycosyltransferase involved in cell wall biosynthesis